MVLFTLLVFAINFSDVFSQCVCSKWLAISDDVNTTEIATTSMSMPRQSPIPTQDYRLPDWIIPTHYDLEIQPYLSLQNLNFLGQVVAWFNITKKTNTIIMHSVRLKIDDIEFLLGDGKLSDFKIENITFDTVRDFLIIQTEEYFQADALYAVRINFNGKMNDTSYFKGFAASHYGNGRIIGVTHFEPTSARAVFPCFDEPNLKATFNVTVVRPRNMTSLSNMPLIKSVSRDDNWVADYFAKSVRMSTYILAFAVTDFEYVESYAGNTLVRIWVRADAINKTALAIKYAPKMLTFLEDHLGIPYALPKLDIIGVPNANFGAMENWGLITFRENYLLYDAKQHTTDQMFTVLSLLAHELSHQWFGNLVTMKWWNDIWLNEGLTTYMTNVVLEQVVENRSYAHKYYSWSMFHDACIWDMDGRTHRLSRDYLALGEITQIYNTITYRKGSVVTRMMEKFAGPEVLLNGLKKYLAENMYSNVDQDELWFRISEELKRVDVGRLDVKDIMDTWTKQKGIPLITVTRNYADQTAFIRQQLFSDKSKRTHFPNNTKWTIPIMFTSEHELNLDCKPSKWFYKDENYVVFNKSDGIPPADEWILLNPSFHGYYLVNYDNRNWKMLINQLISNHTIFPPQIRLSILFSLFTLKTNGYVSTSLAYSILEYLRNERDTSIFIKGIHQLFELNKIFQSTPHYHLFKKYLKYFITPIWEHVNSGFNGIEPAGPKTDLKHAVHRLACSAGIKDCLTRVQEVIFSGMKNVDAEPLNKELINIHTVCSLVYSFSQSQWQHWATLKRNLSGVIKGYNYFMDTLTCTSNIESINGLLQVALDFDNAELSSAERRSFLNSVTKNYFSRRLVFHVLKEKWSTVEYREELNGLIDSLLLHIYSQHELDEIKQLLSCTSAEILSKSVKHYQLVIRKIEQQVKEKEENFNEHLNWLQNTLQSIPNRLRQFVTRKVVK